MFALFGLSSFVCRRCFYWSNNEVHQGICWALLGIGYYYYATQKGKLHWYHYTIVIALVYLGVMTHLLVPISILSIMLFKSLLQAECQIKKLRWSSFFLPEVVLLSLAYRYITSTSGSGYDARKLDPIKHLQFSSIYPELIIAHAKAFYVSLGTINILVVSLLILGIILLLQQRNKWYLALYILSIAGYWVLVNLIYPYPIDRHLHFYMESEYMIMGIVLLAPLVYFSTSSKWSKNVLPIALCIMVGAMSWKLIRAYTYFDIRLQNIASIVQYCNERNLSKVMVVIDKNVSKNYLTMDWGLPIETLSYSTAHLGKSITIKMADTAQ